MAAITSISRLSCSSCAAVHPSASGPTSFRSFSSSSIGQVCDALRVKKRCTARRPARKGTACTLSVLSFCLCLAHHQANGTNTISHGNGNRIGPRYRRQLVRTRCRGICRQASEAAQAPAQATTKAENVAMKWATALSFPHRRPSLFTGSVTCRSILSRASLPDRQMMAFTLAGNVHGALVLRTSPNLTGC